ncbi:hypothetical protein JAAARDRAFT_64329 [Jaapia argillacea MUCL 33604]|uniref:CCHC-type domain-containing protein n=1 Tax=Jaapia argillacea MUCL 33604 TaxID=933084 RepID=A0A067QBP8_9AGAM|nr:hypothetical protein JAAARDRAFT_64329 [Jaapia argillacea MUCL 33604]
MAPEILDLTASSSPCIAVIDLDADEGTITPTGSTKRKGSGKEVPKKRSKKNKQNKTTGDDGEVLETSREQSADREDTSPLFFVDVEPAVIPGDVAVEGKSIQPLVLETEETSRSEPTGKILLPAHVSLYGEGVVPIEIIPSLDPASDDEDYIEYLDYDDRKAPGMLRYFEDQAEEAKQTKVVCKHCGAEGEHKTKECPVQICLTCGARDEHSTRSCPISKTCYSCGMKGHLNRTCPNRQSLRHNGDVGNYDDCDRCGSSRHNTNECPTFWRIYDYVADQDRDAILTLRRTKRKLGIGNGGEGYIATDEWCYNCGECGHWGDDCHMLPHPYDCPKEPSAFSSHNTMSGPFFDTSQDASSSRREPRDWESNNNKLPDGWGFDAPMNVGKEGKKKSRTRMEDRAKVQQEEDDDPDDWFGNAQNVKNRGMLPGPSRSRDRVNTTAPNSKRPNFNFKKERGRDDRSTVAEPPHGGSLLSRLQDPPGRAPDRGDYGGSRERPLQVRGAAKNPSNSRSHEPPSRRAVSGSDRDMTSRRDERGPRYKGGYAN